LRADDLDNLAAALAAGIKDRNLVACSIQDAKFKPYQYPTLDD